MRRLGHMMSGTVTVGGHRRPSRTADADARGGSPAERADLSASETWVRFRCSCGRSVATPEDSDAADLRLCSRCRERAAFRTESYRRDA